MSAVGKRIAISDEELTLMIFGARRLMTKLRGDISYSERKRKPEGLIRNMQRDLVQTRRLHDRLMDIARVRDILDRVTSSYGSESA